MRVADSSMATSGPSSLWCCCSRSAKWTISSHMNGVGFESWKLSPGSFCSGRGGQSLPAHRFQGWSTLPVPELKLRSVPDDDFESEAIMMVARKFENAITEAI